MEIREAKPSEAEEITRELWLPLAREMEEVSEYNELKEDLDIQNSIEHKRSKIESEDGFFFVAVEEDNLTGFISATVEESVPIFSRGDKMTINELFVEKESRRKGFASELIDKIEEIAAEQDVETVELSLDVENEAARGIYEKHGFEVKRQRMVKTL